MRTFDIYIHLECSKKISDIVFDKDNISNHTTTTSYVYQNAINRPIKNLISIFDVHVYTIGENRSWQTLGTSV